jgi:tetratricopeptide (TPR) repeat protein
MKQGLHDKAREHLEKSLDICEETGVEVGKGHVLLSLAELALNGGDPDGAGRRTREALALAEKTRENAMLASAHEMLGQIADELGQERVADVEFRAALDILTADGLDERVVTCRAMYAKVLERRGNTAAALEQLKLAVAASRPDLGSAQRKPGVEAAGSA